jgi:hypothetical protein
MSLFKQLRGKRVMIEKPELKESVIELTPEVQELLDKEAISKWTRLKVHAVGTDVTDIVAGDEVYVSPSMLMNAEVFKIEEEVFMIIPEHAIVIVY